MGSETTARTGAAVRRVVTRRASIEDTRRMRSRWGLVDGGHVGSSARNNREKRKRKKNLLILNQPLYSKYRGEKKKGVVALCRNGGAIGEEHGGVKRGMLDCSVDEKENKRVRV